MNQAQSKSNNRISYNLLDPMSIQSPYIRTVNRNKGECSKQ
jgi:hypothetical protein